MKGKVICINHDTQKSFGNERYMAVQKSCQLCGLKLNWKNKWCSCCVYSLRAKPINLKHKTNLSQTNSGIILILGNGRSLIPVTK